MTESIELKPKGFSRYAKTAESARALMIAEKLPVLNEHGFSRAGKSQKEIAALAAEGRFLGRPRASSLILLALLFPICLGSQLRPASLQVDAPKDAHAVALLVDGHYNRIHSLRANFTESYEGLGMSRVESGTLLLLKPGRMRWDYSSPAGKLFLIDGKFAWFYVRGATQVQRIPAKELDDLRSPLRFLLGHTQLDKELTGLQLAPTSTGRGECVLNGQPKGQENRVRRISLTIVPKTGAIEAIEIEETDGATTRFIFSGEETNVAIPDGAFKFTPPAGVPVVDAIPPL
jgi:outer membrane lipoprotein carrier protein